MAVRLLAVALAIGVAASLGASANQQATARAADYSAKPKAARCAALARLVKRLQPSARLATTPAKHELTAKQRAARRRAVKRRAAQRFRASRRMRELGCKTTAAKRPTTPQPSVPAATGTTTPAGPAAPGSPPGSGGETVPPPPPPPPVASTLGVGAYDVGGFVLRLTRTSVAAGDLTVFFRNYDVSDHNLWIEGPGGEVVERISETVGEGGGGSRTLPVTPGTWRLFCSLPDHGSMTRTLTVTP